MRMNEHNKVLNGVVCWFDSKRGYGFLTPSDGGTDLFIHYSNIDNGDAGFKTLEQGQKVSFELGKNHKGTQACCIRVLTE